MEDEIMKWAAELQSIAQAGLYYGKDVFDLERYQRIREIAAEMIAKRTGLSEETVNQVFLFRHRLSDAENRYALSCIQG